MSESTTTARPYAKAIFEYALAKKQLAPWSLHLHHLVEAVLMPEVSQFIANPATTTIQHAELLQTLNAGKEESVNNLIALLAANKRLLLLPEIELLYQAYREEQEKTVTVEVISFSEVSKEQQQKLKTSLSNRLAREVSLEIKIDPSLLGGAVIRAGDLVIDGSVKGKLNKLATDLAA